MKRNAVVGLRSLVVYFFIIFSLNTGPALALSQDDARFLLTRTGFTPSDAEAAAMAAQPNRASAVAALVAGLNFTPISPVIWMNKPSQFPNELTFVNYETSLAQPLSSNNSIAIQQIEASQATQNALFIAWWTEQMRKTTSPLAERLVMFLENHFVAVSESAYLIWYHQNIFRTCGRAGLPLGCLLHGIMYDPATLTYLDQTGSTAKQPVANFARELMELFTVGIGNYSEQDVAEMARALSGLGIGPDGMGTIGWAFHDNTNKTVLGQTGNWAPDDVVRILLAQPTLTTFIVNKLWLEFVSPTPDPNMVAAIAADLRRDPQLRLIPILGELLSSGPFWAPVNRGTLVKSPVEFVIGAMRELGFDVETESDASSAIASTGERLWVPLNVRGFLPGNGWINTYLTLSRQGMAHTLAGAWQTTVLQPQYGANIPMITPAQYVTWANQVMRDQPLLVPPTKAIPLYQAGEALMRDPAYWLK